MKTTAIIFIAAATLVGCNNLENKTISDQSRSKQDNPAEISPPSSDNPYMSMIGRPYAEYAQDLQFLYYQMDFHMSQEQADTLRAQIREAARIDGSMQWELETELFEITYKYRYKHRNDPGQTYTMDSVLVDRERILRKARKTGTRIAALSALETMMSDYFQQRNDYERGFEIALELDDELEKISAEEYPDKLKIYRRIANMYYYFRDFEKAAIYYRKSATPEDIARRFHTLHGAYNGLGLIYRYHYVDLDTSDEYFMQILEIPFDGPESQRNTALAWEGIAKGNLGANQLQRGNWRQAIELLEISLKRMVEVEDYAFAYKTSTNLAEAYLALENPQQGKRYIQLAEEYASKHYDVLSKISLYSVKARYNAMIGNRQLAVAYMDSTIVSRKESEAEFNAMKLMKANQRVNALEREARQQELESERKLSGSYRKMIVMAVSGLGLVCGLLAGIVFLYRRKREAYRSLVRRSQEWAAAKEETPPQNPAVMSEADQILVERINRIMQEEKPYTDPGLTLTELATRLEVNRSYISAAVNKMTGKNVSNFINDYRVAEAVRIMSDPKTANYTIDHIAFLAGFSDRVSFYRVFKKTTGITPSSFRNNILQD
ncbi:helix-turn-helix domain-containing protein [uncultured Alistipes sp.]|jgi:helix-turn-helix- domain containing protein araC type|uniref:helix-turn-helix domain-containing protein n=1 Tax=uncultured Alistipes sp. TaxID=538949 RepID=UPI0025D8C267|nr:helix-turn-helix domain-containing protein [uncultured Alistipes sp.]